MFILTIIIEFYNIESKRTIPLKREIMPIGLQPAAKKALLYML